VGVNPRVVADARIEERAIAVERAVLNEERDLERRDAVVRIYINLERRTPPANFRAYGPRLVPTFNYFQTAACLFEDGELTSAGVAKVAEALVDRFEYTPERLRNMRCPRSRYYPAIPDQRR
jgi:hypothetical protein